MKQEPRPGWVKIGATSNADVYAIAEDMIAVLPHAGCTDDEASARESLEIQREHWTRSRRRGATIVFMDAIDEQDSGARGVYANEGTSSLSTCFALVGESFYGRALSVVFTGLAKPRSVPTQVFRSLEDAIAWIADVHNRRA